MDQLQKIYEAIAAEGYSAGVLAMIEDYANDIENGRTNITRFTLPEHAGICTGGTPLIGASVVASHARASLEASANVAESSGSGPATWQKALDAIALHNYLFPETAMKVRGFTRDSDGLMRVILTQPYVTCRRLATKAEIDEMVATKGFRDNWNGQGVNYTSDRIALEDMHPANVFIDDVTDKPICIDCIVKFV